MKRSMVTLVVVGLVVALTGCSAPSSEGDAASGGTPSITIWADATREAAANNYAESVEGEVDVTVEVKDATNLRSEISLLNQAKSGWPDVVFADPSLIAEWSSEDNGFAARIDDLVGSEFLDGYGTANRVCEVDGETVCLKNDIAQTVLWYNARILDEQGIAVPTTMDEFAEAAAQLAGTEYKVGALGGNGDGLFQSFLVTSGCSLVDVSDNTLEIDTSAPECTRVADLLQPLLDSEVIDRRGAFDPGFLDEVAKKNLVAMFIGPSWFGDFVFKPAEAFGVPAGEIAAAEMPIWDGNEEAWSGQWGGAVWVVSSHSKFPEAAADAAKYLVSDETVIKEAPTYPAYGPAAKLWSTKVTEDEYYASDVIPAFEAQAQRLSPFYYPVDFDVATAVESSVPSSLAEGASATEVIEALANSVENYATQAGVEVQRQ